MEVGSARVWDGADLETAVITQNPHPNPTQTLPQTHAVPCQEKLHFLCHFCLVRCHDADEYRSKFLSRWTSSLHTYVSHLLIVSICCMLFLSLRFLSLFLHV